MERTALLVVTIMSMLAPLIASGWAWLSAAATATVGIVGFVITLRAEGRAVVAERRADDAERRADDADRREREAHEWEREKRETEQAEAQERQRVYDWVRTTKAIHGTAFFTLDLANLDVARAAERLGLTVLKELRESDGSVAAAMCQVL
jgi:hypothetical protein